MKYFVFIFILVKLACSDADQTPEPIGALDKLTCDSFNYSRNENKWIKIGKSLNCLDKFTVKSQCGEFNSISIAESYKHNSLTLGSKGDLSKNYFSGTPAYSTGYKYKKEDDSIYFKDETGTEYHLIEAKNNDDAFYKNINKFDLTEDFNLDSMHFVDLNEYKINTLPIFQNVTESVEAPKGIICSNYYSVMISPTNYDKAAYKKPDSAWVINNYNWTIITLLSSYVVMMPDSSQKHFHSLIDSIKTYLNTK